MATRQVSEVDGELTRLANRAAALAFASAFAIIVGLVALPGAVRPGEPARRVAGFVATVVAIGVTAWAWRARAQLRSARATPAPDEPRHGRGAGPTGRSGASIEPVGSGRQQPSAATSGAMARLAEGDAAAVSPLDGAAARARTTRRKQSPAL